MAALAVRVSEDPARPLGHAVVTLNGLPRGLETFEFALSRHGYGTNHLGPEGWQGAECWLQPEEAWYSGETLKFVIHPDLVFQLENMPYQLAVRGQGLAETAAVTFVWPLQLELEEGSASAERKVVGGTRVNPAPAPRPEPPRPAPAPQPPPLPIPELKSPELALPDVPIPELGAGLEQADDDRTRLASSPARRPKAPASASGSERSQTTSPALEAIDGSAEEPTRKSPGRFVPPATRSEMSQPVGERSRAEPVSPLGEPGVQVRAERPRLESEPSVSEAGRSGPTAPPQRGGSGVLGAVLGFLVLAALAAAGWWWFGQQGDRKASDATGVSGQAAAPAVPVNAQPNLPFKPAPEPRPAPEPIPAPEPRPAPEPKPAPEPVPTARPPTSTTAPSTPPVAPSPPSPVPVPVAPPPPVAPVPRPVIPVAPVERQRPTKPAPGSESRSGSNRSLEDELKSQFDPTQQELERRLRPPKSP